MTPPTPVEIRRSLQALVDLMPSEWKIYAPERTPYAGRRFEYRSGARALLSAQPARFVLDPKRRLNDDPLDLVKEWSAQVTLPFSAGPETQTMGKFVDVGSWVATQEKILTAPYDLQECRTYDKAWALLEGLKSDGLYLLSVVFDLDSGGTGLGATAAVLRHKLIVECCPKLRSQRRS